MLIERWWFEFRLWRMKRRVQRACYRSLRKHPHDRRAAERAMGAVMGELCGGMLPDSNLYSISVERGEGHMLNVTVREKAEPKEFIFHVGVKHD